MVRQVRILLWLLVVLALGAIAFLTLRQPGPAPAPQQSSSGVALGGPFALVNADGQPYSSARLNGRPNARSAAKQLRGGIGWTIRPGQRRRTAIFQRSA